MSLATGHECVKWEWPVPDFCFQKSGVYGALRHSNSMSECMGLTTVFLVHCRQNTELQVELKRLQENHKELKEKFSE